MLPLAALEELPLGSDEREADHVVARQPELAPGVTFTASLRVAADADRRTGPRQGSCGRVPRAARRRRQGERRRRPWRCRRAEVGLPRHVPDDACARRRVTGVRAAAAARDEVDWVFPRPPHCLLDVGGRLAVHDRPRVRPVEAAVDAAPCRVGIDGLDGVMTVPWMSRASSRRGPVEASNRRPERIPSVLAPSATPAALSTNSRRSICRLYGVGSASPS